MNTPPKPQRVCWPLMAILTFNGSLGAYCAFGLADGSPPHQMVMAFPMANRPPGNSTTVVILFFGRIEYRHATTNPALTDFELRFWSWAPLTAATFLGALMGAFAAYLINRWFLQRRIPSIDPPTLLNREVKL